MSRKDRLIRLGWTMLFEQPAADTTAIPCWLEDSPHRHLPIVFPKFKRTNCWKRVSFELNPQLRSSI